MAEPVSLDDATSRLRLTGRGWGVLVTGIVLFAAGDVFGVALMRFAGLALALLPIVTFATRLILPPRLELDRTVYPMTLAAGDRLRVVAELQNRSIFGVEPAAYADVVTGTGTRSIGGVLPAIASRLRRREGLRRRRIAYGLTNMRRGLQFIGPLHLEHSDGLGLTRRVAAYGEPVAVEVWPQLRDPDDLDVPALRTGDEIEVAHGRSGESDDVITREYRRGDAMRRVHWRASARAGELRVRQEESHSEVVSLVVLDTRPSEEELAGRVDPSFELAVSVAASIAQRLHEFGYDTEVSATHPADDREGMRLAGFRTAADMPLTGLMRRFMLVNTAVDEDAAEIDEILTHAARVGSGPLIYVGRGTQPADDSVLALAAAGSPPIAVLVGAGGVPAAERARFDAAGWQVVTMDAGARDPWATAKRLGVVHG